MSEPKGLGVGGIFVTNFFSQKDSFARYSSKYMEI